MVITKPEIFSPHFSPGHPHHLGPAILTSEAKARVHVQRTSAFYPADAALRPLNAALRPPNAQAVRRTPKPSAERRGRPPNVEEGSPDAKHCRVRRTAHLIRSTD